MGPFRSVLFAAIATLLVVPVVAHAQGVPPDLRAAILLRGVAFERNLAADSETLHIMVVGGASGRAQADGRAMERAFRSLAGRVRVAGRPLEIHYVTYESSGDTLAQVRRRNAQVVYLAGGLSNAVQEIAGTLGTEKRILACGDTDRVGTGCLLSVEPDGERARIVIHVRLARAAGFRFDARMLQLSRVVR